MQINRSKNANYNLEMAEIEELNSEIRAFAEARDWGQFHSVRNLILALVGEVGELAEILQWVPDEKVEEFLSNSNNQSRFEEEFADVLIYILRIASIRGIDIEAALNKKLEVNEEKYPVEKSTGSAKKYTEF